MPRRVVRRPYLEVSSRDGGIVLDRIQPFHTKWGRSSRKADHLIGCIISSAEHKSEDMTDLSGQYFGRYYLSERLAQGGMAVVYKAHDSRLERDVAIKIIRTGAFPADHLDELSKRFEREAKSLAKLSHPNIVKVHDYGEHEGSPYLVMEYLPGGTLSKLLGKPVPWQEALHLLLPVARGLAYAHQRGILHRDIKPANILITEHGDPMLSDFGIAKLFEGDQKTHLTGTGMIVGTPEYMAPEQWTGEPNLQSDLYSLGIVLYELVTGRKPYVADTPMSLLLKQATEPLPPPRKFVPGLPEEMESLLIKALARNPQDRFTHMNALIQAMETLLASAPTVQPQPVDLQSRSPEPMGSAISAVKSQTGSSRPITQTRRSSPLRLITLIGGLGVLAFIAVVVIGLLVLPGFLSAPDQPVATATSFSAPPVASPTIGISNLELGFTLVEPQEALRIAPDLQTFSDLAVERYSDESWNKINGLLVFTVNSKPDVPVLWYWGWCAANEEILQQNLAAISVVFNADGYVIPKDQLAIEASDMTGSEGWKCQGYLTILRDWKPGRYQLTETINFNASINDGKDTFEAGHMLREYTVTISP